MEFKIDTSLQLSPDQYYPEAIAKTQVVLHHTVGGTAKSTFDYWNNNEEHVGTALLVDRPGTIHQIFNPVFWAHHLGLEHRQNKRYNQVSIGVEIASWGALRAGWELNDMLRRKGQAVRFDEEYIYCADIDPDLRRPPQQWFKNAKKLYHRVHDIFKFVDLPSPSGPFRTYTYFDTYTPEQTEAVNWLLPRLCDQYKVERKLIPHEDKLVFDTTLLDFKGIITHCNVRHDKSDLNPSWDWSVTQQAISQ